MLDSPTAGGSIEPRQHPSNNLLRRIRDLKLSSLSRNHRRSSSYADDDDTDKKSANDGVKVMQVAITIALPSLQRPIHIKNRDIDNNREVGENMDRQRMTDYCIGVYECSWH